MTNNNKLVAENIAQELRDQGCDVVFGYPGEGTLELIRAFEMSGIKFVLTHSETGAAFMAAAHGELSGRPGVVVTTLGPGVTNVVTGAAYARLDRAPLLVITDRFTQGQAQSSGRQLVDHRAVLGSVVKRSDTVAVAGARRAVREAVRLATTPPYGPVHLDLPRDVSAHPALAEAEDAGRAGVTKVQLPAPTDRVVGDMARKLEEATRPVIIVGLEANHSVDPRDLAELAHTLRAPVLTTYKAKGVFSETDRLWAGLYSGGTAESSLLGLSDAILAIGLDSCESQPVPWRYGAPVYALAEQLDTSAYYRPAIQALGDLGHAVKALSRTVASSASAEVAAESARLGDALLDPLRLDSPDGSMPAWKIVETVQAAVTEHGAPVTVTVDAGSHRLATCWFWRAEEPQRFLTTNGLGTMGYAVPAAVAAAIERPGEAAIAFTGDGGFTLHGYELETAVRAEAKVIAVVFNDSTLSQIRIKQAKKEYKRQGVDFGRVRYDQIGRALGADGVRVEKLEELGPAVADALAKPNSCVIDVVLTGGEYGEMLNRLRGKRP